MQSLNIILAAALSALALPIHSEPAQARDSGVLYRSDSVRIVASGDALIRSESWDWFGDHGDDYSFAFQRTRVSLSATTPLISALVQPQYVSMWNLPETASPAGRGPSGIGALYHAHNREPNPHSFGFHQAWVRLNGLPGETSIQLGRMPYASGLEHVRPEDGVKFNILKDMRLGDRLISSFEWAAFARAFDGVRIDTEMPGKLPLSLAWLYPTQGGWEKDFNRGMEDVRLLSFALTAPKGRFLPDTEIGLFIHNYRDSRSCSQRVDNSGITSPESDLNITAVGAHLLGIQPLNQIQWDYLIWTTWETGDWYEQDHSAYTLSVETGIQWTQAPAKPWLRIGAFLGSGDSNPLDSTHETFFQLIPGTRKYQLFPYYDLQNNRSFYSQLILSPHQRLKIRLDYAVNYLSQYEDLWYMGTGATQNTGNIFGYVGRKSGGHDQLSNEASITLTLIPAKPFNINLFYAHVWGGDAIRNTYPENGDADYFSIEATFNF